MGTEQNTGERAGHLALSVPDEGGRLAPPMAGEDRLAALPDDGTVRRVASEWHGGQWSALYALASSGAILEGAAGELRRELALVNPGADAADDAELAGVLAYLDHHGARGPVDGWHQLWSDR